MRVYLALPSHDQRYWGNTLMSVLYAVEVGSDVQMFAEPLSGSVSPRVFNSGLLHAVYGRYDCLAILHADVSAEPEWLSTLWSEMCTHDADVISAVVPLKDNMGWTSTGVHTVHEEWRKLWLTECHDKLPPTFDVHAPWMQEIRATTLLLNTGCMLMRLDRPWLHRWHGFQFRTRIVWSDDGCCTQDCVSEDWDMSEQLAAMDCRLFATTTVRCHHWGGKAYASHPVAYQQPDSTCSM